MRNLRETDIIRIMREEWDAKLRVLSEGIPVVMDDASPGLKVIHKKSGIRYTVIELGRGEATLQTPEGKQFLVDKEVLEKEYDVS